MHKSNPNQRCLEHSKHLAALQIAEWKLLDPYGVVQWRGVKRGKWGWGEVPPPVRRRPGNTNAGAQPGGLRAAAERRRGRAGAGAGVSV
jgi:hypothetical protein